MPPYHYIRIGWFNRQTKENGAGAWVPAMHTVSLKRRASNLNRTYRHIMHWIEEQLLGAPDIAVNLGSGGEPLRAHPSLPPPPPPSFSPPAPPPYPPPYPPTNDLCQHLYGDP